MNVVMPFRRRDRLFDISDTRLRVDHSVTVSIFIKMIHDGVLPDTDGLIWKGILDLIKVSANKFVDRTVGAGFECENGEIAFTLLVDIYDVAILIESV